VHSRILAHLGERQRHRCVGERLAQMSAMKTKSLSAST
jgi:hypothetical protein